MNEKESTRLKLNSFIVEQPKHACLWLDNELANISL
jgi:hypothetical protein